MEGLKLAKVVQVHPESHRVDIIMLDDGSEIAGVLAVASSASTRTGVSDMPEPSRAGERDLTFSADQDMIAVVGFMEGSPIVLGYLHMTSTQVLFKEKDRMVYRHASDLYFSIDESGNAELYHPSGTYLRIGESSAHEDLTGKDFEGRWKIDRNTDKTPAFKMVVANGGTEQASMEMTPAGVINVIAQGDVNQVIGGHVTQTIAGTMTADVTGETTINTPKATVNGDALVTGKATLNNGGGGIVTTQSVCAFTGAPHPAGSSTCTAGGG